MQSGILFTVLEGKQGEQKFSLHGINNFEAIPYINTCWGLLPNFPLLFTFCTKGCKYAKLYQGSIHTVN